MQWVPSSTMANVSASPPLIPDGRISRVRLAAMAFPSRTFPFKPKLKCLPTYAPCLNGLISNSTFLCVSTGLQHSVWSVFLKMPAIYREPLCPLKVLPLAVLRPCTTSESATPPSSLIQAHAPNHNPLTTSELTSRSKSSQVVASLCWEMALPDIISAILA